MTLKVTDNQNGRLS